MDIYIIPQNVDAVFPRLRTHLHAVYNLRSVGDALRCLHGFFHAVNGIMVGNRQQFNIRRGGHFYKLRRRITPVRKSAVRM